MECCERELQELHAGCECHTLAIALYKHTPTLVHTHQPREPGGGVEVQVLGNDQGAVGQHHRREGRLCFGVPSR